MDQDIQKTNMDFAKAGVKQFVKSTAMSIIQSYAAQGKIFDIQGIVNEINDKMFTDFAEIAKDTIKELFVEINEINKKQNLKIARKVRKGKLKL